LYLEEEHLIDLIKNENYDELKEWIKDTNNIDHSYSYIEYDDDDEEYEREYHTYPALIHAVKLSKTEIVRLLLDSGSNVNLVAYDHATPLYLAVEAQNEEMVSLLLSYGANVNQTGKYHKTPLFCAVHHDTNCNYSEKSKHHYLAPEKKKTKISIIKLLLNHGAEPNKKESKVNLTPITCAKQYGDYDVLEALSK
jgi:ankyrin repeat protein